MDSATVLVLGNTGHGKSLLANRLLRLNPYDDTKCHFGTADNELPETMESEHFSAVIDGFELTVIDTPGLFDIEMEVMTRWIGVLKGILLTKKGIDAIIFVANSQRLFTAARCFNRITKCFDGLNMTRVIFVFTYVIDTSARNLEDNLTDFNKELTNGAVGVRYIFSDQCAREDVVERNMSDIISYVKDIKRKSVAPINKAVFVKYTGEYLRHFLQSLPQKNVSLGDLRNSPAIDMLVIEEFIKKEDITKMINERNRSREGCIAF